MSKKIGKQMKNLPSNYIKGMEELQNQLYISDKAHQRVCVENVELEQKIEELQREVEIERKHKRKYRSLADNFLEKNYKLKEQVRELEELNNEVQKVWNEDEEIKWKTPIAWYRVLRISDKLLTK
jgi:predicted RNase H-like nuclease (RuvC/YqgF family)